MKDGLVITLLSLLPRRAASRGLGRIADVPSRWLAKAYVWAYDVDLSEAETATYSSLDAVFTRRLRTSARPIAPEPDALVSPVDGRVAWCGPTDGVVPLGPVPLALDEVVGAPVAVRAAVVLYLSPRDYHRVHAPLAGRVTRFRYVPGSRWPVFAAAVRRIPELFARNERLVLELQTPIGALPTVLVGALGVGRITSVVLQDTPTASRSGMLDVDVAKGDEIGVFHLGSTVILGLPRLPRRWAVDPGDIVRMGRPIAWMG